MKITRISAYQVDLPVLAREYKLSRVTLNSMDTTIIKIETDAGITGYGETCPLGPVYQPAFAKGARAGIAEIAPGLIGENPLETDKIYHLMDGLLNGHTYSKAAIDIACWDIVGKALNKPVCDLIGGRFHEKVKAYCAVTHMPADHISTEIQKFRAQGYRHFQIKVGGTDVEEDIARISKASECVKRGEILVADVNGGWLAHQALRVMKAVHEVDVYIEQPCATYEECLAVRRRTSHPMILDECMDSVQTLIKAYHDNAFEGVSAKITRIGGITKMRQFRDLCVAMGKFTTCDDSWGSDLSVAATVHVAYSTPAKNFFGTYPSSAYGTIRYDANAPAVENGFLRVSTAPGLGVMPNESLFGDPVFDVA